MTNKIAQSICFHAIGIALFFGAATAYSQHCPPRPLKVVYCGSEGMSLRCGPGSCNAKTGALYHGALVYPTGESCWVRGVYWQKVSVKGYMKIRSHCSTYLTPRGNGHWDVTWYKPNDNYVSMRSSATTKSCRLAKIYTGSCVHGCHQECGYLFASTEGWVAVRSSVGKTYLQ